VEGVDYDLNKLTEVWIATNTQDARLVSINYRGTQDPAYIPGPFSPFTEAYLELFSQWYAARLIAHGL
jgi:Rieske 2Fe-2S family protein